MRALYQIALQIMIKLGQRTSFLSLLSEHSVAYEKQLMGSGACVILSVGPNIIYIFKSPELLY